MVCSSRPSSHAGSCRSTWGRTTANHERKPVMSRANRGGLFWGALLTLLGLIFLLNNFNLMPARLLEWWPILVLLAGLWVFSQGLAQRRGGELIGGTVLLAT